MQSVQLTKEQIQGKIFELEMELKEQKGLKWCASFGDTDISKMDIAIEETLCYIQYYNDQLQYIEEE